MREAVRTWCRAQGLIEPETHLVCAVSGGADSVAMLHCMCALREELRITVAAAHFNHHLRGAESDRDEAFVRTLCETLGVELTVSGGDVAARAARTGESIEEAARKLRYAFFEELDAPVATAHTADDNLETVLLNLVRGTSLRGLCGIPPRRGRIIRPMLCVTRSQIEQYLEENQLTYVEDSTNFEPDARRNRLRQSVIPLLREENPSLSRTVLRGSLLLRQDEAFLEAEAARVLETARRGGGWSCAALRAQPEALRTRALRSLLRDISAPKLSSAHIEAVDTLLFSKAPSASCTLPGCWMVAREYELLTLRRTERKPPAWKPVRLCGEGAAELPELGLRVTWRTEKNPEKISEIQNSASTFVFGCDMMKKTRTLFVRPRETGDEMRLPGGRRTLKRLMIDRKIPAALRDRLPVIADESGVIGVYGIGVNLDRKPRAGEAAYILQIEETHAAETEKNTGGADNMARPPE